MPLSCSAQSDAGRQGFVTLGFELKISARTNLASLAALRSLSRSSQDVARSMERLSSGLRINRASDDPGGLVLSEHLKADQRTARIAYQNANDAISSLNVADGALAEATAAMMRIAEVAHRSATGTITNAQRIPMEAEYVALASEIARIIRTTQFNDITLLTEEKATKFMVGIAGEDLSFITHNWRPANLTDLGFSQQGAGGESLTHTLIGPDTPTSQIRSLSTYEAAMAAVQYLAELRGEIGATQSRLGHSADLMANAAATFGEAGSRVRDIDVAQEAAELTRSQITQQAATAIMAQANQQPQFVLMLLS